MKSFSFTFAGFVLAVAIVAVGNFVFHVPEGTGRWGVFALAALVFVVFAFGPGRLWGKSLNDQNGPR